MPTFIKNISPTPSRLFIPIIAIMIGISVGLVPKPEYVGAVAFTLVLAVVIFLRPLAGCVLVIVGTLLASGAPRGWPFPFFRLNELIFGGVLVVFLVRQSGLTIINRRLPRLKITDVAFGIWLLSASIIPAAAMFLRGESLSVDSVSVLFAPLQYYALYRLLVDTVRTEDDVILCFRAWLLAGVCVTIIGLLQAIRVPGINEFLMQICFTKHVEKIAGGLLRVTSIFGNWHAMAAFLVFQIIVTVSFLIYRKDAMLTKRAWSLVSVLFLSLIVFVPVVSAAGVAGLFLSVVLLVWFNRTIAARSSIKLLLLLLLFLVIGLLLFRPFVVDRLEYQFGSTASLIPNTFQERLRIWRHVLGPKISQHLLFGSGLLIPEYLGIRTEESFYMSLLFRGGVVALGGFFVSAGLLLCHVYQTFRDSEHLLKPVSLIGLVVLIVTLVMNISNAYWGYSGVAETIWMLIALTDAVSVSRKRYFVQADVKFREPKHNRRCEIECG